MEKTRDIQVSQYGRILWQYLRPHWHRSLGLAVLLFASIGLQIYVPQILQKFIDSAVPGVDANVLLVAAAGFVGLSLAQRVFGIGATLIGTDLGWRATNELREDLAEHCLRLDMTFHKQYTPGKLIERIDGDVLALANFFSQFAVQMLGGVLLLVGILAALYLEDWRIGLAMTGFALVSLLLLSVLRNYAVKESEAERETSANLYGFIEERLSCREDIRANGGAPYTLKRFYETNSTYTITGVNAWVRRSTLWQLSILLFSLGFVFALAVGGVLYSRGIISLGTAYIISQYTSLLFGPIERLTAQFQDLQKAAASIGRVTDLMAIKSKLTNEGSDKLTEGPLSLEFDHVSFTYDDGDERVLQDISFSLAPGKTMGVLGRTGCGKTTLTRLIFRLYDVSEGAIRVDGHELSHLPMDHLRQRVGIVTQDVQLFEGTVRDNITLFDHNVPDDRLTGLLYQLGLGTWFDSLDKGLDSELSAGGGGLSAGEAQLLAFARVFLQDPGVVILDEPSSRLDPATEQKLDRAMADLLKGRTAIIIAHRLGTVERVDDILVMANGRVEEQGDRQTLAHDPNSHFYRLLNTSMEGALA